jgi:hypothetical protein
MDDRYDMDERFYTWSKKGTLVLDPGVFAWDLPRRGADWQVGYFPKDSMGENGTVTSELEQAGQHVITAGEAAVTQAEPVVTKAPYQIADFASRNPWITLAFGMFAGAAIWKFVQGRKG